MLPLLFLLGIARSRIGRHPRYITPSPKTDSQVGRYPGVSQAYTETTPPDCYPQRIIHQDIH